MKITKAESLAAVHTHTHTHTHTSTLLNKKNINKIYGKILLNLLM